MQEDFAYNNPLKQIWNRDKGELKINQCFNAFNLIHPTTSVDSPDTDQQ